MKRILTSLVLLCSLLPGVAADYVPPAANQWDWTPGTGVGVLGGIAQYQPGGASARTTLNDVTQAPYYLNLAYPSTTGTVSAGSSSLVVANPAGFRVNDFVKLVGGWPEVSTLSVTGSPSADGSALIILDGSWFVPLLATDTPTQVAGKIRAFTYPGWTTGGSGTTVTFTSNTNGDAYGSLVIYGIGFTHTISTVEGGAYGQHQITAIAGSTFTVTPARISASGVTDGALTIDVQRSIQAVVSDSTAGEVAYFPEGDYHLTAAVTVGLAQTGITIRGEGPDKTHFFIPPGSTYGFNCGPPGGFEVVSQSILGTKTKGTTALGVADASGFTAGQLIVVGFQNEEDNTRIQAGAIPTWTQKGYPHAQTFLTKIISTAADPDGAGPLTATVNISPGMPTDGTYRAPYLIDKTAGAALVEKVGFEDFSMAPESSSFGWGIKIGGGSECWVSNVMSHGSDNRSVLLEYGYHCEVRRCEFGETVGYSSDGLTGIGGSTACLFEDNIGKDGNYFTYNDGNSSGNAWLYNYLHGVGGLYIGHGCGPCQNLFEGNVGSAYIHFDGYHGNSFQNTIYRNRLSGLIFNRFTRQILVAGNLIGLDGTADAFYSFGNPNMGNGIAIGFAGPTGLSDQVGQIDYIQPGYGIGGGSPNTYVIQPADVFAGDFWADWKMTGTITSNSGGTVVITMDSTAGQMEVGQGAANNGPSIWWGTGLREFGRHNMEVSAISGLVVSMVDSPYVGGVTLPAVGTPVLVWPGTNGFQERDLDIKPSCVFVRNYDAAAAGTGVIVNNTALVLPNSLAHSSQPSWWTDNGFPGVWPPVDPAAPNFSDSVIPAGFRYTGTAPPDPAPPAPPRARIKQESKRSLLMGR